MLILLCHGMLPLMYHEKNLQIVELAQLEEVLDLAMKIRLEDIDYMGFRKVIYGDHKQTRTADFFHVIETLYQLSYAVKGGSIAKRYLKMSALVLADPGTLFTEFIEMSTRLTLSCF